MNISNYIINATKLMNQKLGYRHLIITTIIIVIIIIIINIIIIISIIIIIIIFCRIEIEILNTIKIGKNIYIY